MSNTNQLSARATKRQAIVQRRLRVLERRKAGMTYSQIAQTLEVSERTVRNDIQQSIRPVVTQDDFVMERSVDLLRIEMALLPLSKGVREGDHKAIDRWKQLIDLKQKLLDKEMAKASDPANQELPVKIIAEVDMEKV